jgi:uncharacterized protein (TIRG00374 family)
MDRAKEQRMKINLKRAILIFILMTAIVAFLFSIFAKEKLLEILHALLTADYKFALLAWAAYLSFVLMWATRWSISIKSLGRSVRIRELFLIVFGGIFINNITPFTYSGGDPVGRSYLLSKLKGLPYSVCLASVMGELIVDVPVFLSLISLAALVSLHLTLVWFGMVIFLIVIAIVFLPLSSRFFGNKTAENWIGNMIVRVLKKLRRHVDEPKIFNGLENFYSCAHNVISQRKIAGLLAIFSTLLVGLSSLRLYFIFQAFNYSAPWPMLIFASTLPWAAGLVPLLPGGMGTFDFALISIFLLFGVPFNIALSAVLVERAITFFFGTFAGAMSLSYLGIKIWALEGEMPHIGG